MKPRDYEMEPLPGLPEELPPGERIVWQGRPRVWGLARTAFKIRWLAFYFVLLVIARAGLAIVDGEGVDALVQIGLMVVLFGGCLAMVALLAYSHAQATVYTITSRRVVMQVGVALSTTWNLPFRRIASADLQVHPDGDGDIVLRLAPPDKVSWALFWPHVQPGRVLRASPALRHVKDPGRVAGLLQEAVARWAADEATQVVTGDVAAGHGATSHAAGPAPALPGLAVEPSR